jgi:uncharacterized protein YegJ (DUF2314 family)
MVKALQWKTFFVMCLFLAAACGRSTPTPTSTFSDPDQELAEAVRQAQSTLSTVRQAMLAPKPSYEFLGVKARFRSSNGSIEDMWVEPVAFMDNRYTVRMIEGVTLETGAHPDRLVEVDAKDILDWMIKEKDGTVHGGYTLRVEFKRMTAEQQKRYLEVTGYKFD